MKIKLLTLLIALIGTSTFAQQINQFGQPTFLVGPTNSATLVATPVSVTMPPISLTVTATNAATVVTNIINETLFPGQSNYIASYTFIYNAATMGTNFTTNFPATTFVFTNYTFAQAIPQAGGSNSCYIK